jgi:hypothetical protein
MAMQTKLGMLHIVANAAQFSRGLKFSIGIFRHFNLQYSTPVLTARNIGAHEPLYGVTISGNICEVITTSNLGTSQTKTNFKPLQEKLRRY